MPKFEQSSKNPLIPQVEDEISKKVAEEKARWRTYGTRRRLEKLASQTY
jgi:hypothetical protein